MSENYPESDLNGWASFLDDEEQMNDELQDSLNKIHQESNESRIKLMTLRACFINLARSHHELMCIWDKDHPKTSDWRTCNDFSCASNRDVLIKLELQ